MFGLCLRFWKNGCEKILLASKYSGWIIDFIYLYVISKKNLPVVFLFKRTQFWSLIHQSTCPSLNNHTINSQRILMISTVPKSLNHPILGLLFFTFIFVCSKRISSLVFVIYGGASCCFDDDFHPFTSLCIIPTRFIFLYLHIPISSYSLLIPFISSFTVSTWLFCYT